MASKIDDYQLIELVLIGKFIYRKLGHPGSLLPCPPHCQQFHHRDPGKERRLAETLNIQLRFVADFSTLIVPSTDIDTVCAVVNSRSTSHSERPCQ